MTGATGFIGTHLLRRLQARGDIVIVIGRRRPETLRAIDTFVESDLASLERLPLPCPAAVDRVFHLAAMTPKTRDQQADDALIRENVETTWRLLSALPEVRTRLVFASTLDVYKVPPDGAPIDEHSAIEPASVYGAAKVCAEHLVRIEAGRLGIPWTVARIGHVYGPGERAYQKLIPQTIARLIRGETPVIMGTGEALRDFLFVADAVEALIRAAEAPPAVAATINIVSGTSVTIRQTVETLIQVSGRGTRPQFTNGSPGVSYRFRNGRMRSLLGEWPLVAFEEGLRLEYAYEAQQRQ